MLLDSIEPVTETGYLQEFTELHIVPKSSNPHASTKQQKSKWTNRLSIDPASHLEEKQEFLSWETLNSLWTYILGSNRGAKTDKQCKTETVAEASYAGSAYDGVHVDETVRLYPISHSCHGSKEGFLRDYNDKPFSLNVNVDFVTVLGSSCMCMKLSERSKLIVKACKILSPKDRDMRKKEQRNGGSSAPLKSINECNAFLDFCNFCQFL